MSEANISGITKIAVKGFKSIAEECSIDIRPLTILAGANSSGKSSIMQPLLMLKQTLEAPYDPGPLLLDGPNVQFTLADQFLSKLTDKKESGRFQIQIETLTSNLSIAVTTIFQKSLSEIEIVEMTTEIKTLEHPSFSIYLVLYPEMSVEEFKSLAAQNLISAYPEAPAEALEKLKSLFDQDFMPPKDSDVVKRSRCFLHFETQEGDKGFDFTIPPKFNIFNSIHLPGLRGNPERIYKLTSTGPRYPGRFENYAASIIHKWQKTKDKRLKKVADALYTLGLTQKIGTEKISDVGIELQVGHLLSARTKVDMVNITDVGFGVSQVLPVLVALIVAGPGQLVYLEQPELHLHPRAQVALARVLADAAKRGVRVVAETHSSLLLLGVQTLVAEGDLSPELVKLHWFSRRENGVTEVNSVDLDEAGTYGDWPVDFDDVDLGAQSRYLDAVDNVRFGNEETS